MGNKLLEILIAAKSRIFFDLSIPRYLKDKVQSIIDCRTMYLGGYIYFCPDLHGSSFLYNSCKTRGCPVCMESEQLRWFFRQKQLLFPVKHSHLVFKVPSEISGLWLYNKHLIQTAMFDAAKYAIKKVNKDISLKRGWITVLHTAGNDLSYHPHLHVLITNGGFNDNKKWKECDFNTDFLRKYYNKSIKKKLLKSFHNQKLNIPSGMDSKKLLKTIQSKDFYIQQAGNYINGEGILKYFSKKLKTGPLNHKQIVSYDDKSVTFYYKQDRKKVNVKLSRDEFIRRYLNHMPLKGFRMVRNYGIYSRRHINQTKKIKEEMFGKLPEEKYTPKVLKCPVCGKELIIIKKCSAKEFRKLFSLIKENHPERSPPVHCKFNRFDN